MKVHVLKLHLAACTLFFAATSLASAQVVQLPSYHTFYTTGSVLVPDSGGAFLGGVKRASSGGSEFGGPWRSNVSSGAERGFAGAAVSAQIHDFGAMEALLNPVAGANKAEANFAQPAQQPAGAPLGSVADLKRQQAREAAADEAEARDLYARGQKALAAGKPNVAQLFYRMAQRKATGKLAAEIRAAQAGLTQSAARR